MVDAAAVLNTPPPAVPPAPPAAAAPGTPPTPVDWTSSLSPDLKGFIQERGFKDPAEVAEQYRNLEKLRGVPADKLLRTPDSYQDAKEQETALNAIYDRLGRPKTAKEYAIEVPKENGDPKQAEWIADLFHKAGLTKAQAEAISKGWNERQGVLTKEFAETQSLTAKQSAEKLRTEWGQAYDQNLNVAKAGQKALGWDDAKVDLMGKTLGVSETIKMLHDTGRKVGESQFILGDKQSPTLNTPDGAQAKIKQLMNDKSFTTKLMDGDASAKQQWQMLHEQLANGQNLNF